jgi:acyl carrier protein
MDLELLGILNAVRRNNGMPECADVSPEADLRADLGLSSLDLAELSVRIEDRYGVDVFAAGVVRSWGELCQRVTVHIQKGQ